MSKDQHEMDTDGNVMSILEPLMRTGGRVFGLDHRIPNGSPLESYRFYVDLGREILGLPPRRPGDRGWQRMVF